MRKLQFLARTISLVIFILLCTLTGTAQVTTATLSGLVKDSKGLPLGSATVTVEYPDAGIKLNLITKSDGRFTVPNLRVGGPYKVTINHVTYKEAVENNIFLELGLNNTIEFTLQEKTTELGGVTVTSQSKILPMIISG